MCFIYCDSDVLYKKCLKFTINIVDTSVTIFVPALSKLMAINCAEPAYTKRDNATTCEIVKPLFTPTSP